MAEVAFEAIGWLVELAFDRASNDGENNDHDAIGRYANSLYEERPLPPPNPQDLSR